MSKCPICEHGSLQEKQDDGLLYSECSSCSSEIADQYQLKQNSLMERLRRAENRLLYLDQIRPLIKGACGEGYMQKISFEDMAHYATMWMKQEGIE